MAAALQPMSPLYFLKLKKGGVVALVSGWAGAIGGRRGWPPARLGRQEYLHMAISAACLCSHS